jgi:hypothetical protein
MTVTMARARGELPRFWAIVTVIVAFDHRHDRAHVPPPGPCRMTSTDDITEGI